MLDRKKCQHWKTAGECLSAFSKELVKLSNLLPRYDHLFLSSPDIEDKDQTAVSLAVAPIFSRLIENFRKNSGWFHLSHEKNLLRSIIIVV